MTALMGMLLATLPGDIPISQLSQCGPQALYIQAKFAGYTVGYDELVAWTKVTPDGGCSAQDLLTAAKRAGFENASLVRLNAEQLRGLRSPAILWDGRNKHFLAFIGEDRDSGSMVAVENAGVSFSPVEIPASGCSVWKWEDWDGTAILLPSRPLGSPMRMIAYAGGLGSLIGIAIAIIKRRTLESKSPS